MKRISISHLLIGLAMLAATGLAMAIKPSEKLADRFEPVNLEVLIPKVFGDWKLEQAAAPLVSPDVQAAVNKVYAQTLTRNYVNANGEHIMLSIAYGKDQNDSLAMHLPEGCYGGQGFGIQDKVKGLLKTSFGSIPVARMLATKGERSEPITYWMMLGEHAEYNGWDMKKAKLNYALKGLVPDGLLIRVSSITTQAQDGYHLQERFSNDLLASLAPSQRMRLTGFAKQ